VRGAAAAHQAARGRAEAFREFRNGLAARVGADFPELAADYAAARPAG
jgi:hypothetical protein